MRDDHPAGPHARAASSPGKLDTGTPERLSQWAERIGPDTRLWVDSRLTEKAHPEQAYRVCLGLLNLSRAYPSERLNASCRIANREGLDRLKQIRAILSSNRDQLPLASPELP